MTSNGKVHPPGTIAVPAGEFLRFGGFVHSLACVRVPPGTAIQMMQSVSIPENLNHIIRSMTGEWLWCQADDHIFAQETLWKLLDRQVDVVVPLMIRRSPPFSPVIYKDMTEDGYMPFSYEELPESGMLEVFAAGSGGMLIRKHVLDDLRDPWFEFEAGERLNEDFVFCRKLRDAGYTIWCDTETMMGHRGTYTVWPDRSDGTWQVAIDLGAAPDGKRASLLVQPQATGGTG